MATVSTTSNIEPIGETAGVVWRVLSEEGPMPLAKLVKATGESKDLVMQAIGWLAREGKIAMVEKGRGYVVSLR